MFWNFKLPDEVVSTAPTMFHEYRLNETGVSLWRQTLHTDHWYEVVIHQAAQEAFKTSKPGTEIRILDHNDKLLGTCKVLQPKTLDGGPP